MSRILLRDTLVRDVSELDRLRIRLNSVTLALKSIKLNLLHG